MKDYIRRILNQVDHIFFKQPTVEKSTLGAKVEEVSSRSFPEPGGSFFNRYVDPLKTTDYALLIGSVSLGIAVIIGILATKRFGKSCLPPGIWFNVVAVGGACVVVRIRLNRYFDLKAAVHITKILELLNTNKIDEVTLELDQLDHEYFMHRKVDWETLKKKIKGYKKSRQPSSKELQEYLKTLVRRLGATEEQNN